VVQGEISEANGAQIRIRAEGVHKNYQLGELSSLGLTMRRLIGRSRVNSGNKFAALNDVSFDVAAGQALGIVGRNGSGKSTLLHMICGITLPTRGSIVVRGRLLPLLAIGTSFHLELTGRENVVLFGAILGISRDVGEERMDRIAEFAELEQHLDTPLKRYSDGMMARLSFAIAMLFPADIYVFDEVLAVVDGEFRHRCLGEIERLRDDGKTVLFVSHDLDQVERLCTEILWLDRGTLRAIGETREILPAYGAALERSAS
jgi:homopolymeric O-antigen transport system ATP-binding protein